jgi:hypothetical protein
MNDHLDVSNEMRAKALRSALKQVGQDLRLPQGDMLPGIWIKQALKEASATRAISARHYRLLHFLDRTGL